MPKKNRRELYQRIRYDKNEYYPAVFVLFFFFFTEIDLQ